MSRQLYAQRAALTAQRDACEDPRQRELLDLQIDQLNDQLADGQPVRTEVIRTPSIDLFGPPKSARLARMSERFPALAVFRSRPGRGRAGPDD
jgi:hypothetical protein